MAGKATTEALDLLHGLMANSMTEELGRELDAARQPRFIADENGELTIPNPKWAPLSPKLLGVIRAFLKDNGIDAPASSPRFNPLLDQLRDIDPEDIGRTDFGGRA